jgi:hypothetical protein
VKKVNKKASKSVKKAPIAKATSQKATK